MHGRLLRDELMFTVRSTMRMFMFALIVVGCGSGGSRDNREAEAGPAKGTLFQRPLSFTSMIATPSAFGLHVDLANQTLRCGTIPDPSTEGLVNIGINAPADKLTLGRHTLGASSGAFMVSGLSVERASNGELRSKEHVVTKGSIEILKNDDATFSARVSVSDPSLTLEGVISAQKCPPR